MKKILYTLFCFAAGCLTDGNSTEAQTYSEHLATKCNEIMQVQKKERDGFFYFTDTHIKANSLTAGKIITQMMSKTAKRNVVWGGDAVSAYVDSDKEATSAILQEWDKQVGINEEIRAVAPLYCVHGNHDFTIRQNAKSDVGCTFDGKTTAEMVFSQTSGTYVRNQQDATGCYYYYDVPISKIRYIVLDSNDSYKGADTPWGTCFTTGQKQMDWIFTQAVMTVPSGYSFIFITHVPITPTTATGIASEYRQLLEAIEAVSDHSQYGSYDFSNLNSNRVLMVLSGHMHQDLQTVKHGIWHIVTASNAHYRDYLDSPFLAKAPQRKQGTVWEQLFDYFSITKNLQSITAIRYGAGYNRQFHLKEITLRQGKQCKLKSGFKNATWTSYDSEGNTFGKGHWTMQNSIVTVTAAGKVTGMRKGEANVLATDPVGNKEFFCIKVE